MEESTRTVRLGLCAERIHRLAFDIAMQAAGRGSYGHGLAVVADECRSLAQRLYRRYDAQDGKLRADAAICDMLLELETLSFNGYIESLYVVLHERGTGVSKPVCVVFDELLSTAADLRSLLGLEGGDGGRWLTPSPGNDIVQERLPFVLMTVGGVDFVETPSNVQELCVCREGVGTDGILSLRGRSIPVLKASAIPGARETVPQFLLVVKPNGEAGGDGKTERRALPIDKLPTIFWAGAGRDAQAPAPLRALWPCEEGQEMRFLDYRQLV